MIIERKWAMPSRWTFSIKPIKELLEQEMTPGVWIDPFAGMYSPASVTNDLNPDVKADYHEDARAFLKRFADGSVDGILYDPPYSPRQVRECYDGIAGGLKWDGRCTFWSEIKNECAHSRQGGGSIYGDRRFLIQTDKGDYL